MKKSSKVLIVILTAMLLVGALALAVFASAESTEGKFVVAGVGYETWEEAAGAANATHTIYLNENLTLDESIVVSGEGKELRLNLNGKTITVGDGVANAFNVQKKAKLTITGSGVIDNAPTFIGASGAASVTVEATGKDGIVINHKAVARGDVVTSTFRIHDRASFNLSGFLTVNAVNGTRNVFHMGEGSGTKGAAALNITNAKVNVPLLTNGYHAGKGSGAQEYTKCVILNDNIDVNITDSRITIQYGMMFYITGAGSTLDISSYKDKSNHWNGGAASGIGLAAPTIKLNAKNSVFSSDYSKYSTTYSASGHNPGASFMGVYARAQVEFDECIIYYDFRGICSDATVTSTKINQHTILLNNCHILDAFGDNATGPFMCYGVNFKMVGGSYSGPNSIANGSNFYLALTDSQGNPTGRWVGGYLNDTFLSVQRTFVTEVTGNWVDSTYTEPDSMRTHEIKLLIDGNEYKFLSGYFTDEDLYYTYVPRPAQSEGNETPSVPETPDTPEVPLGPAWDYVLYSSDGNTVGSTGDFTKINGEAANGKNPLSSGGYQISVDKGKISSVLSNGNGYVKAYFDGVTTNGNCGGSKYNYFTTPTGASGSIMTTDAFVFEWDVSTDDGRYANVSFTTEGRMKNPRYDVNGKLLGTSNAALADGKADYVPKVSVKIQDGDKLNFNGKNYTLPTEKGEWTRITLVVDFDVEKEAKGVDIPVYTKSGSTYTQVADAQVTKNAYKLTRYDLHLYVNGEYFDTYSVDTTTIGYDGYLVEGTEANYYIDGVRIVNTGEQNIESSWCVDNVRISQYKNADDVDLALYTTEGEPVQSIKGNEHFLIMLDNSTIIPPPPTYIIVDGNKYEKDEDAIAAIQDGSVIELERVMEKNINVDDILESLKLETINFTIIPHEFKLPTIVSKDHGTKASADIDGAYIVTPVGVVVDGNLYLKDDDAIAAIKNGSVIVLERNMMSAINVDALLEKLGLATIKFEINIGSYELPTILTVNHKVIKSTQAKNTYLVTPIGINVDGVEYGTDAEAAAAIKNGSVVELNRDMTTPINVNEIVARLGVEPSEFSFKVIPGEFEFSGIISSTHKNVDYLGAFNGYLVTAAGFGEVYNISYSDEIFGFTGMLYSVAEGTVYPVGIITPEDGEKAFDGKLWWILGWQDGGNSETANGFFANGEYLINVTPKYKSVIYYYEINVNGAGTYITDSSFGTGVAQALQNGNVKIVLWQNVSANSVLDIKGNLEIELNGKSITASGSESLFNVLPGSNLVIYSSAEGAKLSANAALLKTEFDRRRAGDIAISIADVEINAQSLFNYYDPYVHDPATGKDVYVYSNNFIFNASDVVLKTTATAGAAITSSLPIIVNAQGLNYDGFTALLEVLPDQRATLTANFKDSSFKTSSNLVNVPGEARIVNFEGCDFYAPIGASYTIVENQIVFGKEIITIGKDCAFSASVDALLGSGLVIEPGCIVAPADADSINSYVNVPEAMALVYWIGADGNPIAVPNYNAPFGKFVEQFTWEEANKLVGRLVDNEWYYVGFDSWDIADDYELTAGAVSVYPTWKPAQASIRCLKLDLVAYTYFKLNMSLPNEVPTGVALRGIYREINDGLDHRRDPRYILVDDTWYELLETRETQIGGNSYTSYSVYPGAADASEPEYKVIFELNGELLVDTIYCGVPTYAETVMRGLMEDVSEFDALSENDKILAKLVMNMVRYANESYKLANATTDDAERYEDLLNKYSSLLVDFDSITFTEKELQVKSSELGAYMEGASFIFGSYQPRFVFKYKSEVLEYVRKPETSDGKIIKWPDGNLGLFAVIYHENYDNTKSHSYIAPHIAYNDGQYVAPDIVSGSWGSMTEAYATTVDMNVYNATGIINIELYSPDGSVLRGSYSLAAYVTYLEETIINAENTVYLANETAAQAAEMAKTAREEAAKPENAPLKDYYEKTAAEFEATKLANEALAAENEAIIAEYSSFLEASLSLYAFSLTAQDYDRIAAE